ncbi:MAG: hypothetical protein QOD47_1739 [Gemmatimonadaceae bacterium]|jgi:hypothetical protein|nr:hypothetical protein [Gemmatimonadaceae bacterium]
MRLQVGNRETMSRKAFFWRLPHVSRVKLVVLHTAVASTQQGVRCPHFWWRYRPRRPGVPIPGLSETISSAGSQLGPHFITRVAIRHHSAI